MDSKRMELLKAIAEISKALSIEQYYRVIGFAEGLAAKREPEAGQAATA